MIRARSAAVLTVLAGLVLVLPGQAAPTVREPDALTPVPPGGWSGGTTGSAAGSASAGGSEPAALRLLARAAQAADRIGYAGTQVVVAWHDGGSTSRLVDVTQAVGGRRVAVVQDAVGPAPDVGGIPAGVGLSVLADRTLTARTLAALTSCYVVATGGRGRVAGRPATIVTATRGGSTAARMWLDDDTGLMLRQDVLAEAGKLRRTAAYIDVETGPAARPGAGSAGTKNTAEAGVHPGWTAVPLGEVDTWTGRGWPVAATLADGSQLLDTRTGPLPGGGVALHLTYGDGLSAISVFLQPGRLDTSQLAGWTEQAWAGGTVRVRTGWPEMITWQAGGTVVTAVGDEEAGDLERALARLPRDPAPGPMDSVARFADDAFGWLRR